MSHRAIQLGGVHWHKLLTDIAIQKMEMYQPMHLEFIKIIHVIANDEVDQGSADFDSVCNNIT
eukprot:5839198-Ditylum_brightwellii.AAC.1